MTSNTGFTLYVYLCTMYSSYQHQPLFTFNLSTILSHCFCIQNVFTGLYTQHYSAAPALHGPWPINIRDSYRVGWMVLNTPLYLTAGVINKLPSHYATSPSDKKRPPGRSYNTWLRATESDLRPLNISPSYTWKNASSQEKWDLIVHMAALKNNMSQTEQERSISSTASLNWPVFYHL